MLITKNDMKQNRNAGFTLIEMIAVLVITVILSSLSVAGVLAYQDYSDYKRQNSYAQTLFVTAQTQLTGYCVRGQKSILEKAAVNPVALGTIVTPGGKFASADADSCASQLGEIYYLTGTRETYARYLAGAYYDKTDAESIGYQTLYDVFAEFMSEDSILNACISLEFSPRTGQVYSVLYSDKCTSFSYIRENRKDRLNILDRQDSYRSKNMIGYYGLD